MKPIQKLAGHTAIYGMGTMVPRLLNFLLLTPYFTRIFHSNIQEYGKITELYAYIAFMMIILTYGMETAYFRYVNIEKDRNKVFSSVFVCLLTTSFIFIVFVLLFADNISGFLKYEGESIFIRLLGGILAVEAISAIPFAKMRVEENAVRFAKIRIVQVLLNVGIMVFLYNVLPHIIHSNNYLLNSKGEISAKYIFASNLFSSFIVLILLSKEIREFSVRIIDIALIKKVLLYGLPLLAAGMAGTINETLDRTLYKHIVSDQNVALFQLGIYGANYKLGSLVMIFVQMFRFASEPFFFNYEKEHDAKEKYAKIMDVFVGVILSLSLMIVLFIDYFKFFIDKSYYEGLVIVPWIALAYVFYGIFFNQSIWYKLSNKTHFAFVITIVGALITVIANVGFIPVYGYKASAIGHLAAYSVMMIISYFLGEKYYPIKYNLKKIGLYILLALSIYFIDKQIVSNHMVVKLAIKTFMEVLFITFVAINEKIIKIPFSK